MGLVRAAVGSIALLAAGLALVSGGSVADPRTPPGLRGLPAPFLGTAVVGGGGLTAAIDAYGDVVDLRAPGPVGRALIDNPSERQAAGTVPVSSGIVPWVSIGGQQPRPLWTADLVEQRYRPGTNVLATTARFGGVWVRVIYAADDRALACATDAGEDDRGAASAPPPEVRIRFRAADPGAARRLRCEGAVAGAVVRAVEREDRRRLRQARPLGPGAPPWAREMYRRSLLVLLALVDRHSGAVAAGARDGWAYVWPRDAAAVALALAAAGERTAAGRVALYLLHLDLDAAARFSGDGEPVPGRGPQGDASGWVTAAARAAGLRPPPASGWRERPDYQEGGAGDYLGNALARGEAAIQHLYGGRLPVDLVRQPGAPASGLDSAAAWAVRPFTRPRLFPAARRTLRRLVARRTRFGLTPGQDWPGRDPWTAPTAWSAWSLAALGERRLALALLGDLRRAATAAGTLPERVDARTGLPRSTTPLAWSHAFAILALRELWPSRRHRTARNRKCGRLTARPASAPSAPAPPPCGGVR